MIITYPTGFYGVVLDTSPDVAGNVTYTISGGPPARQKLSFTKAPAGVVLTRRPGRIHSDAARRAVLSSLIFSTTRTGPGVADSGMKRYEPGQILDFQDDVDSDIEPMLVGMATQVRHDTNLLDYEAAGIDDATGAIIDAEASAAYGAAQQALNDAVRARYDAEVTIALTQKSIGEIDKIIVGLDNILTVSPSTSGTIIAARDELLVRRSTLESSLADAVAAANAAAASASDASSAMSAIAQLVR